MSYNLNEYTRLRETVAHLREYLSVMETEPAESLIEIKRIYHDLKRILGDEE